MLEVDKEKSTINLTPLVDVSLTLVLTFLVAMPLSMIHGITVVQDTSLVQLVRLAILARDNVSQREIPLWVWDGQAGATVTLDDEGSITVVDLLKPDPSLSQFPVLMVGNEQPAGIVSDISMRGSTTAFGGGMLGVTLLIRLSFAAAGRGALSGFGLPIPSW